MAFRIFVIGSVLGITLGTTDTTLSGRSGSAEVRTGFKPAVVRFGATVAQTEAALSKLCQKMTVRRIDPPFRVLRDIKDKQLQLDCDGFMFAGKPRWAEFIFGDDSLEMVWIMTAKADETALLAKMKHIAGDPDMQNAKFIAFSRARMALRTDVPEVLFYSERLAPRIEPWFGEKSTF